MAPGLMVDWARAVIEERLSEARGRGLRTFHRLEFPRGPPPPTAVPRRWTTRRYRGFARLRRALRLLGRLVVARRPAGRATPGDDRP